MATPGHVQVAPDSSGKDLDAYSLTSSETGNPTVFRESIIIASPNTYANIADVSAQGEVFTGGGIASGVADAGNPIKIGGVILPNANALPAAGSSGQRFNLMIDEFGRIRIIQNRPKLAGLFYFESGILSVAASADGSTAGRFWLINPVGSTVKLYLKLLQMTCLPTATTAFVTTPRITFELVTFTGTASGATITPAKRASADAAATGSLRTASTGLTLTAGSQIGNFTVPSVLTGVGVSVPYDQSMFWATRDDDDLIVLAAGEGVVLRQPDAGSTSDTRKYTISGAWEER